MFHELVHIVLRASGVCDIDEDVRRTPEEQRIEVFCNRVAAAALIPAASLLSAPPALARPGRTADWDDQAIELLAEQFSVSREAIVRRLLTLGRTTAQFYAQKRAQYQAQTIAITETRKDDEGGGGFESPAIKAVSVQGPSYIRLVLESYYQGRITLSDVSSYLGVRTKHLSRIEKAVLAA
jgi:Zn-dependent peptidase ImmA (M78 family)